MTPPPSPRTPPAGSCNTFRPDLAAHLWSAQGGVINPLRTGEPADRCSSQSPPPLPLWQCMARHGKAWQGMARHGKAWRGTKRHGNTYAQDATRRLLHYLPPGPRCASAVCAGKGEQLATHFCKGRAACLCGTVAREGFRVTRPPPPSTLTHSSYGVASPPLATWSPSAGGVRSRPCVRFRRGRCRRQLHEDRQ